MPLPDHASGPSALAGHDDGYRGPATLVLDDREIAVTVELRGCFQPIDGRYHWYGRIAADAGLHTLVAGRRASAVLRTPQGEAAGQVCDPDLWDRHRILGTGTPPFRTEVSRSPGQW